MSLRFQQGAETIPVLFLQRNSQGAEDALTALLDACKVRDLAALIAALGQARRALRSPHTAEAGQGGRFDVGLRASDSGAGTDNTVLTFLVTTPHASNASAVRLLCACGGADPDAFNGRALKWAAKTRQAGVVQALLREGASASLASKEGLSALHFAVGSACTRSVRHLLQAGVPAGCCIADGVDEASAILHLAASRAAEEDAAAAAEILDLLLQRGAGLDEETQSGLNVLHVAALAGHPHLAQLLLQRAGTSAARLASALTMGGLSPLHFAAGARAFLQASGAWTRMAAQGSTREGRCAVARLLLDAGAPVNAQESRGGASALHWAARDANLELVELLLARGADALLRRAAGTLPLLDAVEAPCFGGWRLVEPLVKAGGTASLSIAGDAFPPLHMAVMRMDVRAAAELLRLGAPVNYRSGPYRESPLQIAAVGHLVLLDQGPAARHDSHVLDGFMRLVDEDTILEMAALLLAHGADPNVGVKEGPEDGSVIGSIYYPKSTPLISAVRGSHPRMAELLVAHGADPAAERGSCLWYAVSDGKTDILRILLRSPHVDVDRTCAGSAPLLHLACSYLNVDALRVVLDAGADLAATDRGLTAQQLLARPAMSVALRPLPPPAVVAARKRQLARLLAEAAARREAERAQTPTHTASASNPGRAAAAATTAALRASELPGGVPAAAGPGGAAAAGAGGAATAGIGGAAAAGRAVLATKACSHCGMLEGSVLGAGAGAEPVKLKRCARCQSVVYCSPECQRAAWKGGHKHSCGKKAEASEARLQERTRCG